MRSFGAKVPPIGFEGHAAELGHVKGTRRKQGPSFQIRLLAIKNDCGHLLFFQYLARSIGVDIGPIDEESHEIEMA